MFSEMNFDSKGNRFNSQWNEFWFKGEPFYQPVKIIFIQRGTILPASEMNFDSKGNHFTSQWNEFWFKGEPFYQHIFCQETRHGQFYGGFHFTVILIRPGFSLLHWHAVAL